jgi:hypothetical protein
VAELHVLLNGPMLAYRHFLKARLVESLTAVIIPLDDSVLFVRLFNCSQLACRKSGTLAKISARHEVGCMGLVRPEGRRFKEMNNPICCGMNRAFYWHHKKGKG